MDTNELCQRLLAASERIANSWSMEEGLSALVQAAHALLKKPQAVAVALGAKDRDHLRIVASRGLSATFINRHKLPLSDPAVQKIMLGGQEVLAPRDAAEDSSLGSLRLEKADGALAAMPMVAMNRPIGVLIVAARKADPFDDEQLLMLKLIARLAASCHDRCALYEERRLWMAIDRATGLWSFEFFCNRLTEEMARCRREKIPLSALLVDIDDFARYKQVRGDEAADELFVKLVEVARGVLRGIDFMGRFGLEDMLVALPNTPLRGGLKAAQRVQEAVRKAGFLHDQIRITTSIGVATLHGREDSASAMIERAQKALYAAVLKGRNCACAEAATLVS